jgi:hypothetical protein
MVDYSKWDDLEVSSDEDEARFAKPRVTRASASTPCNFERARLRA